MSRADLFERLAATARRDAAPPVDVAGRVARAIALPPPRTDRVFAWVAALSAATAAACALLAVSAWEVWADPLTQLLWTLQGVSR